MVLTVERKIFIYSKGWLRQKYHAKCIGENNRTLMHTENYVSKQSLLHMLEKYYPEWSVHDTTR